MEANNLTYGRHGPSAEYDAPPGLVPLNRKK